MSVAQSLDIFSPKNASKRFNGTYKDNNLSQTITVAKVVSPLAVSPFKISRRPRLELKDRASPLYKSLTKDLMQSKHNIRTIAEELLGKELNLKGKRSLPMYQSV